ncbi:hypothetical protein CU097_006853, partial [Rhizopus azygosporus]
ASYVHCYSLKKSVLDSIAAVTAFIESLYYYDTNRQIEGHNPYTVPSRGSSQEDFKNGLLIMEAATIPHSGIALGLLEREFILDIFE